MHLLNVRKRIRNFIKVQINIVTRIMPDFTTKLTLAALGCRGQTLSDIPEIGDPRYLYCLDRGSNATEVKAAKMPPVGY